MSTLLLWLVSLVGAADYFAEGQATADRAVAVEASRTARGQGHDARVVRRYVQGEGWRYLVRVGGFDDLDEVVALAPTLARALGGVEVYRLDSQEAAPVRVWSSTERVQIAPGERNLEVEALLLAHGGAEGGAAMLAEAGNVLFRFRRELPSGDLIEHRWARRGADLSLELKPLKGEAVHSQTAVSGQDAWLVVAGAPPTAQDAERAREVLTAMAPERVIPFVFSFGPLAHARRELIGLRDVEAREDHGRTSRTLQWDGDQTSGPLAVEVDAVTSLVQRVIFEEGTLVVSFEGWTKSGTSALMVPRVVTTWRDGHLVERVEILALETPPEVPNDWFVAP